jgi:GAF domain-containing protein
MERTIMGTIATDAQFEARFSEYADDMRAKLSELRDLIVECAKAAGIERLELVTKWGQPSFVTVKPKIGTTIRIDEDQSNGGFVAVYVHCQTSLVEEWRQLFPHLTFGGNRSVHFRLDENLSGADIRFIISSALTYHARGK